MTDTVNVPREPTREMTMAGAGCLPSVDGVFGMAGALSANVYRAMLEAAPKAEPVRWTEDMERESRESDYERGFRDGKLSHPEAPKVEQEPVAWRWRWDSEPDVWHAWENCPDDTGALNNILDLHPLYTHPAPASDELLEALEAIEVRDYHAGYDHAGNFVYRDVFFADDVRALIAKHKGPQS